MGIEDIKNEYYEKDELIQLWTDYKNYTNLIAEYQQKLNAVIADIKNHKYYDLLSEDEKITIG